MKRKTILIFILILVLLLAGCASQNGGQGNNAAPDNAAQNDAAADNSAQNDAAPAAPGYTQITQEKAKEMMAVDDGHIIVDVRRQDEYDEGHIPGAVLIPNESIGTERPAELPDLQQIILVYCRSGRRSKEAAQKLADMGYVNVYEFGGIIDWTGPIEKQEQEGVMRLKIGGTEVPVSWEDNASVDALKEMLPVTVHMSAYGGFEQVGALGRSLPRSDVQTTAQPGDIMLYNGSSIVIFYGSNTWAYTKLGHVDLTAEQMTELLSRGSVTIKLE